MIKKLFLSFVTFTLSFSLMGHEVLRITNGEWAPYLSERLPQHGLGSRIVSSAFKEVGIEIEYGFFPWKRAFQYGRDGHGVDGKPWHGSVLWIKNQEREKDFYFSDPVIVDEQTLFFLKEGAPVEWKELSDLKGKVFGGTAHTAYPALEEGVRKGWFTINRGAGYDDLFKRLLANRIDAILNVKRVGQYYIRANISPEQRRRIARSKNIIEERAYHLILSRKHKWSERLIKEFNRGLKKIKMNGKYDHILNEFDAGIENDL
jgi:polar amino acid transport system substrate-binding protein